MDHRFRLDYSKLLKVNEHDRKLVKHGVKYRHPIDWWITSELKQYIQLLRVYLTKHKDSNIEDWINCNFPISLTRYLYVNDDECVEIDFDSQTVNDIIEYVYSHIDK